MDGKGVSRVFAAGSLYQLTRDGPSAAITPDAACVLFPDGDRLYRTSLGAATETSLDVQSFTLGHLSVPLDGLLGIVLNVPSEPDAADAVARRVVDDPRPSEVLWLVNGDTMTGGFFGLTDRTVQFQAGGAKEPTSVERANVVAIGFDPALAAYPRPPGGFLDVSMKDGSRLGMTGVKLDEGYVVGQARFGAGVKVPLAEVTRIDVRGPSVVFLTERKVAAEKYVPYVGPARPFRRNATVDGHPFRLGGREYDRGIGTQGRTLLAYRLEPGDKRFQTSVGVDDRAGPLGNVVFRVLVDQREVYVSPPLVAGGPPRAVDVPLEGGRALILITEYGERGGVRDLADWIEARIFR